MQSMPGKGRRRVSRIVCLCLLGVNSIRDIRKREIFLVPTILVGVAGIARILWIYYAERRASVGATDPNIPVPGNAGMLLVALLPGIVLFLTAILSNGKVGGGDALVLLALGAWTEPEVPACTLAFALLMAPIAAMFRKQKKDPEVPFIPFLLAGYMLALVWSGCG